MILGFRETHHFSCFHWQELMPPDRSEGWQDQDSAFLRSGHPSAAEGSHVMRQIQVSQRLEEVQTRMYDIAD